MEQIRQAVERAKAAEAADTLKDSALASKGRATTVRAHPANIPPDQVRTSTLNMGLIKQIGLDSEHIESRRIVAHHAPDLRSKSFDMLRTQTLQAMDQNHWQFLAITSPTPSCGKTLTAVNLALSIARQPDRSALLLDLDFHKPQIADTLGLKPKHGVVSLLDGRSSLIDALISVRAGNVNMMVLPAETRVIDSTELIASRAMVNMLHQIKHDFPSHTVILDLPPLLASDDVISLLPQVDCVLLVAAVGTSTISEIKECNKHLQSSALLRIVLNKTSEHASAYYGHYSGG